MTTGPPPSASRGAYLVVRVRARLREKIPGEGWPAAENNVDHEAWKPAEAEALRLTYFKAKDPETARKTTSASRTLPTSNS